MKPQGITFLKRIEFFSKKDEAYVASLLGLGGPIILTVRCNYKGLGALIVLVTLGGTPHHDWLISSRGGPPPLSSKGLPPLDIKILTQDT